MDAPAKEKNSIPIDLLRRQNVVNRIMDILEVICERKTACTFALNGAWGTGKSFVLNMLMNQLWEYHSDKYIVFNYNCWQYDYYEEPLIAIVAAMLDSVDEENHLLPTHLRDKARAGMELAKPFLQKIATDFVKNKIGVDLTEVVSSAKAYQDALDGEEQKKAEARYFDEFYSFKKTIQQAQEEIKKITKDRTLVVIVDELDRCMPDYAIKVLERLHHLFYETENCAIILALDKEQLETTIKHIFGIGTNTDKYLRKFINFTLDLDIGSIKPDTFSDKFREYIDLFDNDLILTDFPYDNFLSTLFSGIDIRTQEQLIDRVKILHCLFFGSYKADYSIMCFELMVAVLVNIYHCDQFTIDYNFAQRDFCRLTPIPNDCVPPLLDYFISAYWTADYVAFSHYWDEDSQRHKFEGNCVIQRLLYYYTNGLKAKYPFLTDDATPENFHSAHPDTKTFHRYLKTNIKALSSFSNLLREIK